MVVHALRLDQCLTDNVIFLANNRTPNDTDDNDIYYSANFKTPSKHNNGNICTSFGPMENNIILDASHFLSSVFPI